MLLIENLHVQIDGKAILQGIDLQLNAGEIHVIMGPNGSGKSTLANIIAGREGYEITAGSIQYQGHNLLELTPDQRAAKGVFLAFQYPVEIPGVSNIYFLKTAVNAVRKAKGLTEYDAIDFLQLVKEQLTLVNMDEDFLYRDVNVGFSGGEKKRNEVLQMMLLQPCLAVLDETDSGLDIDALKCVAESINSMRAPDRAMLVVTHYQRLLDHVQPDVVHVMADGKIIKSGDKTLAQQLEAKGYAWVSEV